MPKGGARPGSGPKPGKKYRKRFRLLVAPGETAQKLTPAQRHEALKRQVSLCVAAKMSEEAIAEICQVSVSDLQTAFPRELKFGSEIVRAGELARLDVASAGGSVPAAKALLATANGELPDIEKGGKKPSGHQATVHRLALQTLQGGKT